MTDVVFVVPPFADAGRPAIGVSLLQSAARRDGFTASIEYCNVALAATIGADLYAQIAGGLPAEALAGEWFFADLVFGDALPDPEDYLRRVLRPIGGESLGANIAGARAHRARFVERSAAAIEAHAPRIVGFTTTFHQTCASLAIAKRLKEGVAPPVVMFGGANCEGEMGAQLARSFPWIDYVCTGEGDVAFPELLRRLLCGERPVSAPGFATRAVPDVVDAPAAEMDRLPIPDFGDYLAQLDRAPGLATLPRVIPLETARGCWWGAKHHCTFCGLNGATMTFRSKSPQRALDEIRTLRERSGIKRIDCVDNILDMRYITTVFPELAAHGPEVEMFFEVKANLRYEQLQMMRAAGVVAIQPGIESLDDGVLQLMRKGCTALQNITLLRWCRELGITAAWNLLGGFPREPAEAYHAMSELLPLLVHLDPPSACSPVRLDRFSPFATAPDAFGMRRVRPAHAYYYVYPLERRELERLAYFFDFDYADGCVPLEYMRELIAASNDWRFRHADRASAPALDAFEEPDGTIRVHDTRPGFEDDFLLDGLDAEVFARCDTIRTASTLDVPGVPADEVAASLARLRERRVLIAIGNRYLSLAVFRTRLRGMDREYSAAPAAQPLLRAG